MSEPLFGSHVREAIAIIKKAWQETRSSTTEDDMSENGKGRLFEFAVLYHPAPKFDKNGNETRERSKLIVPVEHALVSSEQEALILASRKIPDEYLEKLEEVEIAVRPF